MGVGAPAQFLLMEFGDLCRHALGHVPYHVGSSLKAKDGWRDVDVRVLLPDEEWDAMGFGDPKLSHQNARWVVCSLAFSALGQKMTGLPIDFQFQRRTEANAEFKQPEHLRSALVSPIRFVTDKCEHEYRSVELLECVKCRSRRSSVGLP